MNLSFRPTFWPTVFTIPAVLLMLGLGVWQLQRLQWKEALINERVTRTAGAPIALPGPNDPVADLEYHRVLVEGEFLHDKEIFLGARSLNGNAGYHLVTPLRLGDGRAAGPRHALIDQRLLPLQPLELPHPKPQHQQDGGDGEDRGPEGGAEGEVHGVARWTQSCEPSPAL